MSNEPYTLGSIDPYKLAETQQTISGVCVPGQMERALKLLANDNGGFEYQITFGMDEDQRCIISGVLNVEVELSCQRCLQPFIYKVASEFLVSPVISDKMAKILPKTYEPVLLKDGKFDLFELLEDEAILALPQVAMHNLDDIMQKQKCREMNLVTEQEVQEVENPFQVLQKLKTGKKSPEVDDQ